MAADERRYLIDASLSGERRMTDGFLNGSGSMSRRIRSATRGTSLRAMKFASEVADRISPPTRGVVVLLYHRVGGASGLEIDLPTTLFVRQMETLSQKSVLSIDEALSVLSESGAHRGASVSTEVISQVVVTFDDGTADFVDTVLPWLVRFGIPATLYVATRFIEEGRDFPGDGRPLSWAALREVLSTRLVTVGSHTHSHVLLDRVSGVTAEEELKRSVDLIEQRLGVRPQHFAYPKAIRASAPVEVVVRRLFTSAALAGNRANVPGQTDFHRLARSPIQTTDGMHWFEAKRRGGLVLEDRLRNVLNTARYARARG
jgi:peptidoglycan/xylan/chitin deacetylase (PgdA/CDA1 family)